MSRSHASYRYFELIRDGSWFVLSMVEVWNRAWTTIGGLAVGCVHQTSSLPDKDVRGVLAAVVK